MRSLLASLAALSLASIVACSSSEPEGSAPGGPTNPTGPTGVAPTFHKDVAPILQKSCQGCHVAGGIAPFPLTTYQESLPFAGSMVFQTASRTMPPWGAHETDECKPPLPWKDDLRLTDAEIAIVKAWHDAGDPEGDPKDAPPPLAKAPASNLVGAVSLKPSVPYSPPSGGGDKLRCFVLDPQIAQTSFIDGTHFVPGNVTVVHHALAFAIPPGANVPGEQYDCFGGPNVAGSTLIAAWAPGGVPSELPAGVGMEVEPGTKFVVQVHYHPHANATPDADATTFQYRLAGATPAWRALTYLVGNFRNGVGPGGTGLLPGPSDPASGPEFRIPANATGHVETMRFTMPSRAGASAGLRILGVGAHMHLAGRDEKITITRAGGAQQCLLQEPKWDFGWQRGYQYDGAIEALPTIAPGDVLEMRCTYDNTMQNRTLAEALVEEGLSSPKDIVLGEQSTDEMCLGAFTVVVPR